LLKARRKSVAEDTFPDDIFRRRPWGKSILQISARCSKSTAGKRKEPWFPNQADFRESVKEGRK